MSNTITLKNGETWSSAEPRTRYWIGHLGTLPVAKTVTAFFGWDRRLWWREVDQQTGIVMDMTLTYETPHEALAGAIAQAEADLAEPLERLRRLRENLASALDG